MDFSILSKMDATEMLAELLDPTVYKGFLQVMSRFSSYSWRNIFLIFKQMPHASMLADFDIWKEQYKRKIIRDSKSIKIYIPIPQKPRSRLVEKNDPTTETVMLDDDGKKMMEEVFIETPPKYKPTSYMDISQTEGAPVPRLAGDVVSDEACMQNMDGFLRKMALTGYILRIDMSEVRETLRLLANATNNIKELFVQGIHITTFDLLRHSLIQMAIGAEKLCYFNFEQSRHM